MRKNPGICFEIDSKHNMANWQSVISRGEFEEITEKIGGHQALQNLDDRIL